MFRLRAPIFVRLFVASALTASALLTASTPASAVGTRESIIVIDDVDGTPASPIVHVWVAAADDVPTTETMTGSVQILVGSNDRVASAATPLGSSGNAQDGYELAIPISLQASEKNTPLTISAVYSGDAQWTEAGWYDDGPLTVTDTGVYFAVAPPNPNGTPKTGYWMLAQNGGIFAFGDTTFYGTAASYGTNNWVDMEKAPFLNGYWLLNSDGDVVPFGSVADLGSFTGTLASGEEFTSISKTTTGKGYWLFTNRGRVVPFGDAKFYGDMSQVKLNGPVLDSIPTASGLGYYMVASDGGIFAFGDAQFRGSMGNARLNAPVQSLVPDVDGTGYWLVASDGGIFAFDAPFYGSMGAQKLNRPVTGMVASGPGGYLMVAEDGGIFAFGTATFRGSLGNIKINTSIVSVTSLS